MSKKQFKFEQVTSLFHLKRLAGKDKNEFFISLNCNLRSSKHITYDKKKFQIINYIDDSEQCLTDKQLMNKSYTNIGEALKKKALYYYL